MQAALKFRTPEEILALYFERKKSKNTGYSLRALARDLGKSPAFVSQILSGKRKLPADLFAHLSDILEVDEMARRQLGLSLILNSNLPAEVKSDLQMTMCQTSASDEHARYEESHLPEFDLLRNWYYIAVLDLVTLSNFQNNPEWISKKLKISVYQAQTAVQILFKSGLLVEDCGSWKKSKHKLRFSTKNSKESVRLFHKQLMEKAITELTTKTDEAAFKKRLITGLSIATNPDNLERAKVRLNEMMFELSQILSEGECTELYHIGAQLFSLTENLDAKEGA